MCNLWSAGSMHLVQIGFSGVSKKWVTNDSNYLQVRRLQLWKTWKVCLLLLTKSKDSIYWYQTVHTHSHQPGKHFFFLYMKILIFIYSITIYESLGCRFYWVSSFALFYFIFLVYPWRRSHVYLTCMAEVSEWED